MEFFRNSEGRLHVGRFAGVLFALALIPGCLEVPEMRALCWMRILYTTGWWLLFGAKRAPHRLAESMRPMGIIGVILLVAGIAGQFYFAVHR